MPQHPRFEVQITIRSEILDDRFQDKINEEAKELSRQAAAYVEVSMATQLLNRLTKQMPAQLAQYAVSVFVEELSHVYAQIGAVQYQMLETPSTFTLPAPLKQLAPPDPDVEEATIVPDEEGPQVP